MEGDRRPGHASEGPKHGVWGGKKAQHVASGLVWVLFGWFFPFLPFLAGKGQIGMSALKVLALSQWA